MERPSCPVGGGHDTKSPGETRSSTSSQHPSRPPMPASDEEQLIARNARRDSHTSSNDPGGSGHQYPPLSFPFARSGGMALDEEAAQSRTSLTGSQRSSVRIVEPVTTTMGGWRRASESAPVPSPLHRASIRDPSRRMRRSSANNNPQRPKMPDRAETGWRTAEEIELGEARATDHSDGSGASFGKDGHGGGDGEGIDASGMERRHSTDADSFASAVTAPQQFILPRQRHSYVRLPLITKPVEDDFGIWIKDQELATPWLSLFYDLAVGAVLSAFNGSHELQTADGMPSYFGYYTVIMSIWTTQLHYDIRYEADDALHRFFKACHLMLFVYIGAASGGWDLSAIILPESLSSNASNLEKSDHGAHEVYRGQLIPEIANDSFLTVAIAIAIHHALLIAQYSIIVRLARKAGRPTLSPRAAIWFLVTSTVLLVVSAAIPARSNGLAAAKITLLYVSVLNDFFSIFYQVVRGIQIPLRWHQVAERYGSLTLIILGQGFSKVTTVFQNALSGVGQDDTVTYAQVFLVIGVMYDLWFFLFANFRQNVPIDAGRTWLYEIIHFPLHFVMLLLLLSMVNAVNMGSFGYSFLKSTEDFFQLFVDAFTGRPVDEHRLDGVARTLAKVSNGMDVTAELDQLFLSNVTALTDPQAVSGVFLKGLQLWNMMIIGVCGKTGVEPPDSVITRMEALFDYNATDFLASGKGTQKDVMNDVAYRGNDIMYLLADYVQQGIYWLYPAAGVTLILCALRSMTRYHFSRPAHWIVHGMQIVAGVALALLGALDTPNGAYKLESEDHTVTMRALDDVVYTSTTLVIPFLVYTTVVVGSAVWIEAIERWPTWGRKRRERKQRARGDEKDSPSKDHVIQHQP